MKKLSLSLLAILPLVVGCSGGSSAPDDSGTVLPVEQSVDATAMASAQTNLSGETGDEALSDAASANDLMAETQSYLETTRATYTKTVGSVTATVTVTPVSRTKSTFTIVLNGGSYSNFTFAEGTTEKSSNGGKAGRHQLATFHTLKSGGYP